MTFGVGEVWMATRGTGRVGVFVVTCGTRVWMVARGTQEKRV